MKKKKNKSFWAVILSGGGGERFWPLSTDKRPKQFLKTFGGKSLLRQAVDRLSGLVPPKNIIIITGKALVSKTRRELPEIATANIIAEPCRRDTGAAIATACAIVERRGGDNAVAAILTADQLMGNVPAFRQVLADSTQAAVQTDAIVTMGVTPSFPATGFGYIRCGASVALGLKTSFQKVRAFVEKPNQLKAKQYLRSGEYVWNAGMFVWRVAVMREAFKQYATDLFQLEQALAAAPSEGAFKRLLTRLYEPLPRISIDYAVMEKTKSILVSRGDFGWDDVGTWSSAHAHLPQTDNGNAALGNVTLLDTQDTIALSDGVKLGILGVKGLVIVATKDGILVADRARAQDLKKLVAKIKQ